MCRPLCFKNTAKAHTKCSSIFLELSPLKNGQSGHECSETQKTGKVSKHGNSLFVWIKTEVLPCMCKLFLGKIWMNAVQLQKIVFDSLQVLGPEKRSVAKWRVTTVQVFDPKKGTTGLRKLSACIQAMSFGTSSSSQGCVLREDLVIVLNSMKLNGHLWIWRPP